MKIKISLLLMLTCSFCSTFANNISGKSESIEQKNNSNYLVFNQLKSKSDFKIDVNIPTITFQTMSQFDCCQFAFNTASISFIGCDGQRYTEYYTGSGFACADDCHTARVAAGIMAFNDTRRNVHTIDVEQFGPPCN